MSWWRGRDGAGDPLVWREALTSEFARAEQEGLLRYATCARVDDQSTEALFLTARCLYARCYSPISQQSYGPLTVIPLDRVILAGPIGRARTTRWGLVVDEPEADVEMGQQPVSAYAYGPLDGRSHAREFAAELRRVLPAGRFGVLRDETAAPGSTRPVETGLLVSATADAPGLRRRLERSWVVLDARSRGVPIPERDLAGG